MTDPARIADQPLPPEIAERMESVGFSPQVETLMQIITDYRRLQAEARAKAERVTEAGEMWPLKGLVPIGVEYEQARRAAERGHLVARKVGGRWFCTKPAMARWVAATGRRQRR
jgi:hypothetical protein